MSNELPSWTNPKEFPKLISDANSYYHLGLSDRKVSEITRSIEKLKAQEADDLSPIGVRLVGKGDFAANWKNQYAWLQDRMIDVGYDICNCVNEEEVEQKSFCDQGPSAELIQFNLRHSQGGVNLSPNSLCWAGLEFMTLLCLSPQCYPRLNGEDLPYICTNGVRFAMAFVPIFCFINGQVHIQARFVNHNGPDKSEFHFWAKTQIPTISVIRK